MPHRTMGVAHVFISGSHFLLIVLQLLFSSTIAGIPTDPEFFPIQLVDHANSTTEYWTQRFYSNKRFFAGPGHPIILILGGEGEIEPNTGIFYPVVVNKYAKSFGALVVQPEHRFYGVSQPISREKIDNAQKNGRPDPRIELFTTEQALKDAIRLSKFLAQKVYGCNVDDKSSRQYCPILTVGGSYPGFMSAMARFRFPNDVDIAYAASAPMKFYAQQVPSTDYYDHITSVAEASFPSCSRAIRKALYDVVQYFSVNAWIPDGSLAESVGVCKGTVPVGYIADESTFIEELMMVVGYTFANQNMAYYPPSEATALMQSCMMFSASTEDQEFGSLAKVNSFLTKALSGSTQSCWNMTSQLPSGANASISAGDWSGVGTGSSGESWDFQTCTLLVEKIGFGPYSMFPHRNFTYHWLEKHCKARFGTTPAPFKLVKEWNFDKLVEAGANHILFTNGLKDGWSVSGILSNLSSTLLALNFPNGAHHSDLNGHGPRDDDTPDIRKGYVQIQNILAEWLEELPSYKLYGRHAVVSEREGLHGGDSKQALASSR